MVASPSAIDPMSAAADSSSFPQAMAGSEKGIGAGEGPRGSKRGTRSPPINPATPHFNPRGYID